ncbi:hypothetical protein [Blastochloris sulfoviridis]|uniref:Uncharacterized protein n=1 Tax=Blastochloris sulfoviridis TaxID=50712 RepID=A0A5M6HTV1_9HYPH|nr:hypothetical protein [Blastochloris sulfoviridis]KAA5599235.1 hypothetical protein F1193_12445 [Blastochloris sulfoviridis]
MARGRVPFRQADVKRAVAGVIAAGVPADKIRVEVDPAAGRIVVTATPTLEAPKNALDEWRARNAR